MRLTVDQPGKISFQALLTFPKEVKASMNGFTLIMTGTNGDYVGVEGELRFQVRAKVIPSGGVITRVADLENPSIKVAAADSALIVIAAVTSYKSYDDVTGDPANIKKEQLLAVDGRSFGQILADHVTEHRRLFRRFGEGTSRTRWIRGGDAVEGWCTGAGGDSQPEWISIQAAVS